MTDKSVFEITKEKYLKQLQPLEGINNEIKTQMKKINDLIPTISDNSMFPMGDNSARGQYFGNLENLSSIFFEKVPSFSHKDCIKMLQHCDFDTRNTYFVENIPYF